MNVMSAGYIIGFDRQRSDINNSVGDLTFNRSFEPSGVGQQGRRSSILQTIGQGIGGIVNSWLGPLSTGVGSLLGGISSSLASTTPRGPVSSLYNSVTEPSSDIIPAAVNNEWSSETVTSEQRPEFEPGDYKHEKQNQTQNGNTTEIRGAEETDN